MYGFLKSVLLEENPDFGVQLQVQYMLHDVACTALLLACLASEGYIVCRM